MFARFDENQAMTFQDIKETKRYGRTDGQTDGRTHGRTHNVKTVYPTTNKVCGGYNKQGKKSRFSRCPLGPFLSDIRDKIAGFPQCRALGTTLEALCCISFMHQSILEKLTNEYRLKLLTHLSLTSFLWDINKQ